MNPDNTRGNTVPRQGETETQDRVPRSPHERDESADNQGSAEPSGRAAAERGRGDVERGVRDTSKQPEMERAYDWQKLKR